MVLQFVVRSFSRSFSRSFVVRSFFLVCPLFVHSMFARSFVYCSLVLSCVHSFVHSFIRSFVHSFCLTSSTFFPSLHSHILFPPIKYAESISDTHIFSLRLSPFRGLGRAYPFPAPYIIKKFKNKSHFRPLKIRDKSLGLCTRF